MFGNGTTRLAVATLALATLITPMAASAAQPQDYGKHEREGVMAASDLPAPPEPPAVEPEPVIEEEQPEPVEELWEDPVEYALEATSSDLTGGFEDCGNYVQEYDCTPSYGGYMQAGSAEDFMWQGIVTDGENVFTYYSQSVLPGGGLSDLNSNGRHVGDNGFVYDGDGYIAVATDAAEKGSVIETPWGAGKVYDCGSGDIIDVYVK